MTWSSVASSDRLVLADLHLHSRYSDGSYTVADGLEIARNRGVHCVSFVDHDTTAGTVAAVEHGRRLGIRVIPGVEISAYDFARSRRVHILGYGYREAGPSISRLCAPTLAARDRTTREQVAILGASGYDLSIREVEAVARGSHDVEAHPKAVLYKQHIMMALVEKGYCDSIYSGLYRQLFKNAGICAREIPYVDAFDAVEAIREDGGIAVLAHPGQLDSWELAEELISAGLGGIELHHEDHSLADRRRVIELCRRFPSLLLTGGSDDHGVFGSVNHVGDICAPRGTAERLIALQANH